MSGRVSWHNGLSWMHLAKDVPQEGSAGQYCDEKTKSFQGSVSAISWSTLSLFGTDHCPLELTDLWFSGEEFWGNYSSGGCTCHLNECFCMVPVDISAADEKSILLSVYHVLCLFSVSVMWKIWTVKGSKRSRRNRSKTFNQLQAGFHCSFLVL